MFSHHCELVSIPSYGTRKWFVFIRSDMCVFSERFAFWLQKYGHRNAPTGKKSLIRCCNLYSAVSKIMFKLLGVKGEILQNYVPSQSHITQLFERFVSNLLFKVCFTCMRSSVFNIMLNHVSPWILLAWLIFLLDMNSFLKYFVRDMPWII